jgi:quinoprotein glucose dehydrogenase
VCLYYGLTAKQAFRLAVFLLTIKLSFAAPQDSYSEWTVYNGTPDGIHYSSLNQINRANVNQLRVAWTYDTGDAFDGSEMECNPIVVRGVLYATSPKLRVIALDAATGTLKWSFDPYQGQKVLGKQRSRGVTYWGSGEDRRIFFVARHYLYALDATSGKPLASFGSGGRVDLRQGFGRDPETVSITATSPGIVYKDLLILGSLVSEDLPSAPGDIRAFDARTGQTRWSFHTIPHPGEFGYETWPKDAWKTSGGANSWAGMALDEQRGLIFASTGSAAFDFYGADRIGDNLFANCVLALKADTGERVWHFQAVRHDVWDRDFPAAPTLLQVKREGRLVDVLAQITKSGHVFVLDRSTGKPLFPVESRSVPGSDVDGESLAKTQLLPLKPPPFARQIFGDDLVTTRTPEAHRAVLERLHKLRSAGQFTPPSIEGTVIFPGFDGGGEWGGPAFDPESGLLYVNSNEMAWILRLVPRPALQGRVSSRTLYIRNCASCHLEDLRGSPPEFPSLIGITKKYSETEVAALIRKGAGRMPAFSQLSEETVRAITRYITSGEDSQISVGSGKGAQNGLKYAMDGYNKFLDPDGYPAVTPPWGTLNAINLNTGEIAWKIPLGEFPELAARGLSNTGSENYGGPLVTAGGLLFIAATNHDRKFRAFDKTGGKLLWEATLPAAGNATPATYQIGSRQFVVIAAGGGKSGQISGGKYVAFALPQP